MSLPPTLDPKHDAQSPIRLIVWVVGALATILVVLTALALLLNLQREAAEELGAQFLVSLDMGTPTRDELAALTEPLAAIDGIRTLEVLPTPELASANVVDVPTLLLIEYDPDRPPRQGAIEDHVQAFDKNATIREPAAERSNDAHDIMTFQLIVLAALGCCFLGIVGIVAIAANTALKSHHKTLDLLKTMGASDEHLAYEFEAKATAPLLFAVLVGLVLGLVFSGLLLLAPIGRLALAQGTSTIFHPVALICMALVPALVGSSVVLLVKFMARHYLRGLA